MMMIKTYFLSVVCIVSFSDYSKRILDCLKIFTKILVMFLESNPVYLEVLFLIFIIPIIVILQLWIINIIHKQNRVINLSLKERLYKLFLLNIILVIYCISIYEIFQYNFFTSNIFLIFCIILPVYLVVFYLLLFHKYRNYKWKWFKILIFFWLLMFLTRILAIIIFSLILDPHNIILESLNFSPFSHIFPFFMANLISFKIIPQNFTFSLYNLSIKNDTIEKILLDYVIPDLGEHCKDLVDALKEGNLLHLELNETQIHVFKAFCWMNVSEQYTFEGHKAGLTKHLLMRRPNKNFPNRIDISVEPFNTIYSNTNPRLSVFTLLGDVNLDSAEFLVMTTEIQGSPQHYIDGVINQAMLKRGWDGGFDPEKMMILGYPKRNADIYGSKDYYDTFKIYGKINLDSSTRWDFGILKRENDFIYQAGTNFKYRLGNNKLKGDIEFILNSERHVIPKWRPKRLVEVSICGLLHKHLAGCPEHLLNYY